MKNSKIVAIICIIFLFSSCLPENDITLVLNQTNPIDDVVPLEYRIEMEEYMPFYNGNNPPYICDEFLISPMEVVFSSGGGYEAGKICTDTYILFEQNEDNDLLRYVEESGDSYISSDSVFCYGTDNNFTSYFVSEGKSSGVYVKMAMILSGTIDHDGISNVYYAFIMLDKGPDPKDKIVDVGVFRIFKDSDNLAEDSNWYKSAFISDKKGNSALSNITSESNNLKH